MTVSVTNGRRVASFENSECGISPVLDRMPAPNTFVSPCSSISPNSMLNQLNRLSASTWSPCRVVAAQLVECGGHFAQDARLLRVVLQDRRAEPLQPVLPAQGEQLLPPRDVLRVVFPGVARFQFQFGHVGWDDHRPGVDGRAVLDERVRFFHGEVPRPRSEEHTSELQSQSNIVCRLLLEKKKLRTQL